MTKRMKAFVAAFFVCFALAGEASATPSRKAARSKSAAAQRKGAHKARPGVEYLKNLGATRSLPFSEAVRVGNMLYLAGQIGTDSSGAVVAGGVEAETRQTLENVRAVLERHNSSLARVVKCTVMLVDLPNSYAPMNGVYRTFFAAERMPARSTFGASALALGARVEIECWATVN